jgi:hypothetical protein
MGVKGVTPGVAYTLLSHKDCNFANDLVKNLRLSDQLVPEELQNLARLAGGKSGGHREGGHSRGGIGNLDVLPAMTSAMLVDSNKKTHSSTTSSSGVSRTVAVENRGVKQSSENSQHRTTAKTTTPLQGFVRATTDYVSVSQDTSRHMEEKRDSHSQEPTVRKKSRWE